MNDSEIRQHFHIKKLHQYHYHKNTRVIDELGLNHGKSRADIAVINGHMVGYEIKSDNDSLARLKEQVKSYNSVFDKAYIITGDRFINRIHKYLPVWWGIVQVSKNTKGIVRFKLIRKAQKNKNTQPLSIARLLWRDEAVEILKKKEKSSGFLRQRRAILYEILASKLSENDLKKTVRNYLKKRENWRDRSPLFQYGDLYQPDAIL